jgi:hypothetical protein
MTVYVVMPPDQAWRRRSRFMRALVGAALSAITATNDKPQFNVLFLLDEFAQLGRMQAIEDAISARARLRRPVLALWCRTCPSSRASIREMANLPGQLRQAVLRDGRLRDGQVRVRHARPAPPSSSAPSAIRPRPRSKAAAAPAPARSQQLAARSLLTPDEVMRQGATRPIVLVQGERPYSLERINYLADREYAGLADPNPFHR